jgi:hypothetical protein
METSHLPENPLLITHMNPCEQLHNVFHGCYGVGAVQLCGLHETHAQKVGASQADAPLLRAGSGKATGFDESPTSKETSFSFDNIYTAQASNRQIFEEVLQPGVAKCLEGYNFTVFCYGQTGTGERTY